MKQLTWRDLQVGDRLRPGTLDGVEIDRFTVTREQAEQLRALSVSDPFKMGRGYTPPGCTRGCRRTRERSFRTRG